MRLFAVCVVVVLLPEKASFALMYQANKKVS